MKQNEFELEEKYKLFRSVKELLHPTISKRNISNYKIIVDENILLLRVFYPKKVSNIKKVIINIPGEGEITDCEGMYSNISATISKEVDQMLISIDYEKQPNDFPSLFDRIYETIDFIYQGLRKENIAVEDISLMGDSTGANILLNIVERMQKNNLEVGRMILFYPVLSGEYQGETKYPSIKENTSVNYNLIEKLKNYYKKAPKEIFPLNLEEEKTYSPTLLLSGNVDPLVDEAKAFKEKNNNIELKIIDFAYHGFLNTKDKEMIKEYLKIVKSFMNPENND
ncbi:MAG: alpha/beta hydrolase [Bacilli bacterium]|nr:alpha/beta hydrolase [Bacilli bacterium]